MEEFEDIRVIRLVPAKSEVRGEGGSLLTGKVQFFFELSANPPTEWRVEFEQRWLKSGSSEKAALADDGVYIRWKVTDGAACAETLKTTIGSTNSWYRAALKELDLGEKKEADLEAAIRQQVEDLAKNLKFD